MLVFGMFRHDLSPSFQELRTNVLTCARPPIRHNINTSLSPGRNRLTVKQLAICRLSACKTWPFTARKVAFCKLKGHLSYSA